MWSHLSLQTTSGQWFGRQDEIKHRLCNDTINSLQASSCQCTWPPHAIRMQAQVTEDFVSNKLIKAQRSVKCVTTATLDSYSFSISRSPWTSAQFYQVIFGGVSNVLSKKKKKRTEDWREGGKKNIKNKLGSGGQGERASIVGHPPPSTLSSGLCLVLQGTKLLTGTTVLSSEYFRALKML